VAAIAITSNNKKVGGDFADNTAAPSFSAGVSASSGLSKFPAGAKYYYTGVSSANDPAPGQSVTVNASATWGSSTNPYVIKSINDWVFFTNAVNNGTAAPSGGTAYASATYVVDAAGTLNFGSKALTPVGTASRAFSGTVYGGNTVISNAKFGYFNTTSVAYYGISSFNFNASGLFGNTSNAKIYDLTISSNCSSVLTGSYDFNGVYPMIGAFSAKSSNPYFVNCTSKMPINIVNTNSSLLQGSAIQTLCKIGGIVGEASGSAQTYVGCSNIANVTYRGHSNASTIAWDGPSFFGGLVGFYTANCTLTVSGCYVSSSWVIQNAGTSAGGIAGGDRNSLTLKMQNTVINVTAKNTDTNGKEQGTSGYLGGAPELSTIVGWSPPSYLSGSFVNNVAIKFDGGTQYGSRDTWFTATNVTKTNVTNFVSGTMVNNKDQSANNASNSAAVDTAIKGNTAIKNVLNVNASTGAVSGTKYEAGAAGATYYVNYVIGGLAGANQPATT
ncbi:MAG: hypothetical protein K2L72_05275, partial [Clostridia bacterium]|nr:hypothetical protein [Clostridia bacterium]